MSKASVYLSGTSFCERLFDGDTHTVRRFECNMELKLQKKSTLPTPTEISTLTASMSSQTPVYIELDVKSFDAAVI